MHVRAKLSFMLSTAAVLGLVAAGSMVGLAREHKHKPARAVEEAPPAAAPATAPSPAPALPERIVWKADGAAMVRVAAGPFLMGGVKNENEKPRRSVTLPDYYIDRTEVSFGRYLHFCKETGRQPPVSILLMKTVPESVLMLPAENVTWDDADAYCKWAGKRLPGEAEWEKACAGPSGREFAWGNGWNGSVCTNRTNSGDHATAVGSRPGCISPYGAMDMSGNVWEWTADWYKAYPGSKLKFDMTGTERVVKGGSFFYSIYLLRCADRYHLPPDDISDQNGFRCVVTPGKDFADRIGG
jgi:sulfatase modifying factor 1